MASVSASKVADDLGLADRCAGGDRAAQVELFRTHRARVHATLYRILGSNHEIEDLIQETFMQVFRSIGSFRGDAQLATWISRLTTRVAYAHLSRRKIQTVPLEAVMDTGSDDPSAQRLAVAREAMRRLYGILDRIDPKQRVAFALHAIDGRPLREVADMTESTLVATKTRVWRARKEINRRAATDPLLQGYLDETNKGTGEP